MAGSMKACPVRTPGKKAGKRTVKMPPLNDVQQVGGAKGGAAKSRSYQTKPLPGKKGKR